MREDGAPVTWPGIVCCVRLAHTADRAAHCYVSYLLHTSDSAHAAWAGVCVSREFLHQSHYASCVFPAWPGR